MESLLAFFRNCYGKAIGFRFKDWSDYRVDNQQIAVADGSTQTFQLTKVYKVNGGEVVRKITKPVPGTVQVFFQDIPMLRGVVKPSYNLQKVEVDYNSGMVRFQAAPKEGQLIYAKFEFDIFARFDTDVLNASLDDYGVHSWRDIPIIEIKE